MQRAQHSRIVGSHEKHQWHDKVRRVEGIAVIMLDKGLAFLTPPLGHDLYRYWTPNPLPSTPIGRKRAFIGQSNSPVHRYPAHHFRVDEMASASAHFPDAFIR